MTDGEKYYRIYQWRTTQGVELSVHEFDVIKVTPRGVWIQDQGAILPKRFVLKDARKRFACETVEAAWESFIARKKRQIKILKAQTQESEQALSLAENRRLCCSLVNF